ncbi:MAG: T9SS type A sorting domain-containing protein, partial [Saprospiraceae bacterium]|nr:T9SS type A sorting domain-containing protein [Saprospiraceae bacterium]
NGCFDNASLCGDTIYVPDVVSSISPLIEISWLQIYPNPADDHLVVRSEYPMSFEIKNILGVTCLAGKIQAGENSINIAMLPGGVFNFVAIPENQSYITTKTIVVR